MHHGKITIDTRDLVSLADAIAHGITTPAMIADYLGTYLIEECLVLDDSPIYVAFEETELEYSRKEFSSMAAAAREYVESGSWGEVEETIWVTVHCYRKGVSIEGCIVQVDCEDHKIQIDPDYPSCTDETGHGWKVVSNRGNGGGIICVERCDSCGCEMTTDTWSQDQTDGEQGLMSIRYERHPVREND
jgi:hypothetical protein